MLFRSKGTEELRRWWDSLYENDRSSLAPEDRKILKGIAATANYHRANPEKEAE